MIIRRAPLEAVRTGPATNTVSPADSALVVVLVPPFLTTVSLTISQVQVVPSGDLITPSLPLTDAMVTRSNEIVWKPVLLWKVTVPSTPPSRRSRPSAHRTLAGETAEELPAAAPSAEFTSAACALDAGLAAGLPELDRAGEPPPDTAARVIPPPMRKPARAAPTPQRCHRFVRDPAEGSDVPAG